MGIFFIHGINYIIYDSIQLGVSVEIHNVFCRIICSSGRKYLVVQKVLFRLFLKLAEIGLNECINRK